MPIKPENKARYPKNWKQIREQILERANNCCEFCGVANHSHRFNEKTGKYVTIVLTIAHMNEIIEDVRPENLRALCQRCHNQYDAKMRARHRKENKSKKDKSLTFDFDE
jgi:5-methylcytosine-specific restriction endonuclease McrA